MIDNGRNTNITNKINSVCKQFSYETRVGTT